MHVDERHTPAAAQPDSPEPAPPPRDADEPPAVTLQRIEHLIESIRGLLSAAEREQRYREFSIARLVGGIAQAAVVGLLCFAAADWFSDAPIPALFKLVFALVLQTGALTGFVVDGLSRRRL